MTASAYDSRPRVRPERQPPWVVRVTPGLLLVLLVAAVATVLGRLVPIVGGRVFGIVLGAIAAAAIPGLRGERWTAGYALASTHVLQLSIVVLGTGLSLQQVLQVGGQSLPVMLGTLAVALGGAWLLGRWLGVHGDAQILIGVGTGICGASAIAATTAVIKAKQEQVAYAIGTIFTFNIAAVLLFPPLGHLLGMSPRSFGLWAGTAINDTSSVVAAAYAYGGDAGSYGLVVKLTRTLMLIPIVTVLAILSAPRTNPRPRHRVQPADHAVAQDRPAVPPRLHRRGHPRHPRPDPAELAPHARGTGPVPDHRRTGRDRLVDAPVDAAQRPGRARCCSARCSGSRSPAAASPCKPSPAPPDPASTEETRIS